MKSHKKLIYVWLSCTIICFALFITISLFYNTDNKRNIYNAKLSILSEADSSSFFDIYKYDHYELFPYAIFLSNKYNCDLNYYIYSFILDIYNMNRISDKFSDLQRIKNVKNFLLKSEINQNSKYNNEVLFSKSFLDSCLVLSNDGYFDKQIDFKIDSMTWNWLLVFYDKALNEQQNYFAKTDMEFFYIMGYLNFFKRTDYVVEKFESVKKREKNLKINDSQILNIKEDSEVINESHFYIDFKKNQNHFIIKHLSNRIKNGNITSYEILKKIKKVENLEHEMLLYSFLMANKFNYKKAYWDVYCYLWQTFNYKQNNNIYDLSNFDSLTKEIAIYYLKKSEKNEIIKIKR